ncbi:hypothetical protein SprV_0301007600 [Sparganum proliferum]
MTALSIQLLETCKGAWISWQPSEKTSEKTVVTHQPPPNTANNAPQISVSGTQLQVVGNFEYLGGTLSRSNNIEGEKACRISKASQAFDRLQSTVWNRRGLQLSTKRKM